MGRHDHQAHFLHIPKDMKFKQRTPKEAPAAISRHAPQQPKVGSQSMNQYR